MTVERTAHLIRDLHFHGMFMGKYRHEATGKKASANKAVRDK